MFPVEHAEQQLLASLAEQGFDAERPDVATALRAFRAFGAEPVEAAEDALLLQAGVYEFTGKSEFQFDLTRQFVIEVDGEYEGMQQLHLTFFYVPTPELAAVVTTLWSSDCASSDDFFARVEAVCASIAQFRPVRFELFQEEV